MRLLTSTNFVPCLGLALGASVLGLQLASTFARPRSLTTHSMQAVIAVNTGRRGF